MLNFNQILRKRPKSDFINMKSTSKQTIEWLLLMVQHTYVLAEIKFVCCRVFPTLGGDACDADMYPEVKLKPDTESEKVKTSLELIEREYLDYNDSKT